MTEKFWHTQSVHAGHVETTRALDHSCPPAIYHPYPTYRAARFTNLFRAIRAMQHESTAVLSSSGLSIKANRISMASPRPRPDLEGPFFSTCHGQSHPRLGVPWLRKPLNGEDMDAMMGWWDDGIWMDMGTLREQPSSFLFTKCREKSSLFPRYARP